jgi:azurin
MVRIPMSKSLPLALACAALLLAGCGPSTPSATTAAVGTAAAPRMIELTANDTMKYDVTSIKAKPGEYLTIVLTNIGSMPAAAMSHDWVLLKQGADAEAFDTAAAAAKDNDYIPASLENEIIAKIGLLGPRKSGQVTFQVPTTPGDYTYLCTFPAHFQAGMKGTLTVE